MKYKFSAWKSLFVSLFGITVFLIVTEVGLRAAGYLYTRGHRRAVDSRALDSKPDTVNILCLGDSFTYGHGAIKDEDYPEQLERLLQNINKNIIVTNRGVGGYTSSLVLYNLEKEINEHKPQLIIAMIGINNSWNLDKSSYFYLYSHSGGFWSWLAKNFSSWRVYKLIKIITLSSKAQNDPMIDYNEGRIRKMANASIESDSLELFNAGFKLWVQGKRELARQKYIAALDLNDRNYAAYFGLARIGVEAKQYLYAKDQIWKGIYALDSKAHAYYLEVAVNLIDQLQGDLINPQFELIKVKEHLKNNYRGSDKQNLLRKIDLVLKFHENENLIAEVIGYDLKEIIKIYRNYGATVVLQTYPSSKYTLENNAIRQISNDYNTPLVDNEKIFTEKIKLVDGDNFFVPDGHCNAKGYGAIAENIYNLVVNFELIRGGKEGQLKLSIK